MRQAVQISAASLKYALDEIVSTHQQGDYRQTVTLIKKLVMRATGAANVPMEQTADIRLSDFLRLADRILDLQVNFAHVSALFFTLADCAARLLSGGMDESDNGSSSAPTTLKKAALAFFEGIVEGDATRFEAVVSQLLQSESVSQDERVALASTVSTVYQIMPKKRVLPGYERLAPEIRGRFLGYLRERLEFVRNCTDSVGASISTSFAMALDRPTFQVSGPQINILMLVEDLSPLPLNTATKLIVDWLYLLVSGCTNVAVIILAARNHAAGGWKFPGVHQCSPTTLDALFDSYGLDKGCLAEGRMRLLYMDTSSGDYVHNLASAFSEIAPDCVVTLPTMGGWVLDQLIYDHYPVTAIEVMNGVNLAQNVDQYIPNGKPGAKTMAQYGDRIAVAPIPQIPFPKQKQYTRKQLALPAEALVIVSVGADFDQRITPEHQAFWNMVTQLLESKRDTYWLMVGVRAGGAARVRESSERIKALIDQGRIRLIDYETDLRALYECCDIFALPPIAGGGRGVALAASSGLAIAAFSFSDAANYLPVDQIHPDLEHYFAALKRLLNDASWREGQAEAARRIFSKEYLAYSAQRLLYAVFKAMERFEVRRHAIRQGGINDGQ